MARRRGSSDFRFNLTGSKWLRFLSMAAFYFAQGLPIGLFLTAVAAWVSQNGASPSDVAFLVTTTYLPWSFKFFAAVLMDRFTYPAMGRRRIWIIGSQSLIVFGLLTAAVLHPSATDISLIAYVGFMIFLGSAMQDVAIDGLAVDILPDEEQGTASAFMFAGQALGIAIGAALGGYFLTRFGSRSTFLAFLPLVVVVLALAIMLREREGEKLLPWTTGTASPDAFSDERMGWISILKVTVISLLKRDSMIYIVAAFMVRVSAGIFVAFWPIHATREAGWSTEDYSTMAAVVGLSVAGAGVIIGAWLNAKLGPRKASIFSCSIYVIIAGFFIAFPQMGLLWSGLLLLYVLTDTANLLVSICSNPLRMRLSDKRVAATQFTVYNSLANLLVPVGAWILALTSSYGGTPTAMSIVVVLTLAAMLTLSFMRIGDVVDTQPDKPMHLAERAQRVD